MGRTRSRYAPEARRVVREAWQNPPDYHPQRDRHASPPCGHAFPNYTIPPERRNGDGETL